MAISDLPILAAIKGKMNWHQARQKLLAENIANAETPGYRGRDLAPYSFEAMVKESSAGVLVTRTTQPGHIATSMTGGSSSGFGARDMKNFEVTPEGNGVVLEDEMMKLTANQMDYQAATSLYSRSLKLIRTALGRS